AWSLPEEESRPFIKKALEAGINFFDTANRYSLGSSEEILGHAIKDFARRNEIVILVGESQCNLRDEKRADWPNQQPGPARSRNVLPSSVPSACASAMAPSRWSRISSLPSGFSSNPSTISRSPSSSASPAIGVRHEPSSAASMARSAPTQAALLGSWSGSRRPRNASSPARHSMASAPS